jgi:phosphoenolpyruvate carboxylase
LIAETETGFTLLAALYYARLFGVERNLEILPLFETEQAFERGERVIEEALKSAPYREYLARLGRLAVQFGYSDSGRFLGQSAATFRIERLRLRFAQLLERHELGNLEVILFNTHGESIGRGGHPLSLDDRLRYLAPAPNRAEFSNRGVRVKEEVSFQGGDGYLPFLTSANALAVVARIVDFCLGEDSESAADPIYSAPDYAAEFFATVQQEFASLVRDPDYAALLGLYGTRMLYRTGSRPAARVKEEWGAPAAIEHPAQLRAIPNNAILQQAGFLANTLFGVGAAAARGPEMFAVMRARSPRFRRALDLVYAALELSDLEVMRAYAHVFDPGLWLTNSGRSRTVTRSKALRELSALTERMARHERVARVIRRLEADHHLLLELMQAAASSRRQRVTLLHALEGRADSANRAAVYGHSVFRPSARRYARGYSRANSLARRSQRSRDFEPDFSDSEDRSERPRGFWRGVELPARNRSILRGGTSHVVRAAKPALRECADYRRRAQSRNRRGRLKISLLSSDSQLGGCSRYSFSSSPLCRSRGHPRSSLD